VPYFGAKNPMWKGGIAEYPNHGELKKNRLVVLNKANHICQVCRGIATEVHHIDKTKTNHKKENLLPVCHKCNCSFHRDVVGRPKGFAFFDFDQQIDICYLYITSLITMTKIAKIFNCSNSTIKNILCAHSIPCNTKNHPPKCNRRGRPPKHRKMKRRRDFIVSKQLIPQTISKIGNIVYAK